MRENEFEKRVQHKMEDFGLHPSGEVWVNVERRIRREKKRRFIFWWLIGIIGIGGGAAVLLFTGNKDQQQVIVQQQNSKPPMTTDSTKAEIRVVPVKPIVSTNKIETETTNSELSVLNNNSGPISAKPEQRKVRQETKQLLPKRTVVKDIPADQVQTDIAMNVDEQNSTPMDPVRDSMKATRENAQKNLDNKTSEDSILTNKRVLEKKDSIIAEHVPGKRENKTAPWNWGVSFSAGRSRIVSGINIFSGPENFSNSGGGGVPVTSQGDRASTLKGSGSWAFEGFAGKRLSPKWSLHAGFGYQYFSTKMTTGERVDSTRIITAGSTQGVLVNQYYRLPTQGDSRSYTNKYHLLTLSAELSWMIVNTEKIKVNWNNGLIYGRLLGSSMLHYDEAIQGYYKNNRLLNRNHLFVTSGFSIPFSRRLQLDPFILYGLTPVQKYNQSAQTSFFNYGVRVRLLLNKK